MSDGWFRRVLRSPRFWKWAGIVLAIVVALTVLGVFHWAPIQSGRVVDMRTGKPIEGAIVKRVFYMPSPPTLIGAPAPTTIPLTYRETRTGKDGRFHFDPIFFPRLAGMALLVFKPGMMPFAGCYVERSWRWGGCTGFGFLADAWNQGTFTKTLTRLAIEISIREPTMDGIRVEDWPYGEDWMEFDPKTGEPVLKRFPDDVHPEVEYLRRVDGLEHEGWVPQSTFEEAIDYVLAEKPSPSYELISALDHFLPPTYDDSPRWRQPRVLAIAALIVEFCDQLPSHFYCNGDLANKRIDRLRHLIEKGAVNEESP